MPGSPTQDLVVVLQPMRKGHAHAAVCAELGVPYRMRVADATSGDTFSASHLRMNACTSCACAGDATCAHGKPCLSPALPPYSLVSSCVCKHTTRDFMP